MRYPPTQVSERFSNSSNASNVAGHCAYITPCVARLQNGNSFFMLHGNLRSNWIRRGACLRVAPQPSQIATDAVCRLTRHHRWKHFSRQACERKQTPTEQQDCSLVLNNI